MRPTIKELGRFGSLPSFSVRLNNYRLWTDQTLFYVTLIHFSIINLLPAFSFLLSSAPQFHS